MKLIRFVATIAIALSLVVLPIIPMGNADAASNYTYKYTTSYNYSYSSPVRYYNTTNTYSLHYDQATGKYYLQQKPSTGTWKPTPVTPDVPSKPVEPAKPTKPVEQPKPEQPAPTKPVGSTQFEQKVVELVNQERVQAGLKPLVHDGQLSQVAKLKSEDMRDKKYFSHTSPTYGSPFDMLKQQGVSYRTAGENIAAGQNSPEQVVQAWMNSPGHKANILNSQYNYIGVGYASGGSYGHYWTQMFIGK